MFSSVDLPQPDGPTKVTNSPRRMSRRMPRTASTLLPSTWKVLPTPSKLISVSPISLLHRCQRLGGIVVGPAGLGRLLVERLGRGGVHEVDDAVDHLGLELDGFGIGR